MTRSTSSDPSTQADAIPTNESELQQAIANSRKILHQRALAGGIGSAIPIPGLDWAIDVALLSNMLPRINEAFGLSNEQMEKMDPEKRAQLQGAATVVGSMVVGKLLTRQMAMRLAKTVGTRLASKKVVKFIPLAGTAVAASLGYAALRYLGEMHIKDCVRVVRTVQQLPEAMEPNLRPTTPNHSQI